MIWSLMELDCAREGILSILRHRRHDQFDGVMKQLKYVLFLSQVIHLDLSTARGAFVRGKLEESHLPVGLCGGCMPRLHSCTGSDGKNILLPRLFHPSMLSS